MTVKGYVYRTAFKPIRIPHIHTQKPNAMDNVYVARIRRLKYRQLVVFLADYSYTAAV